MFRLRLSRGVAFVYLAASLLSSELFAAGPRVPNASLEVTVRQKEGGKHAKGLHLFYLLCWDGECSLTTLSLNQCGPAPSGKPAFYPKIERTSTREGNLKVSHVGNVLHVQQTNVDIGGLSTTTLRFGYAMSSSGEIANKVTSFSGGYVKDSQILGRVFTIEYVPLLGTFHEIQLDCAAGLPGVEKEER
ncbi:MAG: hypothetical protein HY725_08725 [Candidatus Rokubacteria bacterium]|nr:hypothetical protein [Candidatus Rokubacteria bacterium]